MIQDIETRRTRKQGMRASLEAMCLSVVIGAVFYIHIHGRAG